MLDFDEFEANQQKIYDNKFRGKQELVASDGLKKCSDKVTGGYLIALRYTEPIVLALEVLSKTVVDSLPRETAMLYPSRIIHTTISDYGVKPIDKFRRDESVLERMKVGVSRAIATARSPTTRLGSVLYNQGTAIVEGHPDQAFVDLTNSIVESCDSEGIELRDPWGGHVTIARFTEDVSASDLEGFLDATRDLEADFGPVRNMIKHIDIVSFAFGPFGMLHETYETLRFRR